MYKATITGKRQITIPIEICNKLKVNVGNQIEFIEENEKIIVRKLMTDDSEICPCCNKKVYKSGNYVTYNGKSYHINCFNMPIKNK